MLAVIVGIGSTLFSQFTAGFGGNQPTIDDAMAIVLGALSLLGLGIFGPGIANGIVSGGPQLGAGAAVGTGLAAGGVVVAGAGLAAGGAGLTAALSPGRARRCGARRRRAAAYRAGGASGVVTAGCPGAEAVGSPLRRAAASMIELRSRRLAVTGDGCGGDEAAGAAVRRLLVDRRPARLGARMRRAQTISQGASAATHAVKSGDGGGGGASVDLSEGE